MKCKIVIEEEITFTSKVEAKKFLRDVVNVGIFFLKVVRQGNNIIIKIYQTSHYQTQREAKIKLKEFVDAGILLLEVARDN